MKTSMHSMAVTLIGVLLCVPVAAEEKSTGTSQGQGMMQGKGMGQGGGMGMDKRGGMGMGMSDEHMRDMQEDMLKMHALIDRINATEDPKEREKLKEEHLGMMKAHHAKMMAHRQSMMQQHMQHGMKMQGGMKMDQPAGQTPE